MTSAAPPASGLSTAAPTVVPSRNLAAALFTHLQEVVRVATNGQAIGADVIYDLDQGQAGHVFEALANKGLIDVDVVSGLAMVRPPPRAVEKCASTSAARAGNDGIGAPSTLPWGS